VSFSERSLSLFFEKKFLLPRLQDIFIDFFGTTTKKYGRCRRVLLLWHFLGRYHMVTFVIVIIVIVITTTDASCVILLQVVLVVLMLLRLTHSLVHSFSLLDVRYAPSLAPGTWSVSRSENGKHNVQSTIDLPPPPPEEDIRLLAF
jgi:hypothetical protein